MKSQRKSSGYRTVVDSPFRMPPAGPGAEPAIVETLNMAFAVVADLLGLAGTCPRRACRGECACDGENMCQAEFPPLAAEMALAVFMFARWVSPEQIVRLQDALEDMAAKAAGKAAAAQA